VNVWQYPDVSGEYVFQTSEYTAVCTDGSGGSHAADRFEVSIAQSADLLTFYDLDAAGQPIIEDSQMKGSIDMVGNFTAKRDSVVTIPGLEGLNRVKHNLTGRFTEHGWSGTCVIDVYSSALQGGCAYTATFTGSQI
jgi:hypothetical protein